jgi:hypothetical protein
MYDRKEPQVRQNTGKSEIVRIEPGLSHTSLASLSPANSRARNSHLYFILQLRTAERKKESKGWFKM